MPTRSACFLYMCVISVISVSAGALLYFCELYGQRRGSIHYSLAGERMSLPLDVHDVSVLLSQSNV